MNRLWILTVAILCAMSAFTQQSAEEQAVWRLEHSYWEYVKAQDVALYKGLWHENFLGWPSFSAKPVRKDHVADWLIRYDANGLRLESYDLKPAGTQSTGNLVVVHYLITTVWTKKDSSKQTETGRIMHTWLHDERGWQIISGMSATESGGTK